MPNSKQHFDKAQNNLRFLDSFIDSHQYNDWTVTVAFYTAVHIIEGAIFLEGSLCYKDIPVSLSHSDELPKVAAQAGIDSPGNYDLSQKTAHILRRYLVDENFRDISHFYEVLYTQSRTARYRVHLFADHIVDMIVSTRLRPIIYWANKNYNAGFVVKSKLLKTKATK
ncbi:MAG: hypothetical protein AB1454_05155 [Candidatus Auribacterota bacterium]